MPSNSELPKIQDEDIWNLADENNFGVIISVLLRAGINENSMGEALFPLAKQAIARERFNSGRLILQFLLETLVDQEEAYPLIKIVGDLYTLEKNPQMAREYYLKLPIEPKNIRLYLDTFKIKSEFDELLEARNQFLVKSHKNNHPQIHGIVDGIVKSFIAAKPEILAEYKKRYEENFELLKDFFAQIAADIPSAYSFDSKPCAVKIGGNLYGRQNGIWFPIILHPGSGLNTNSLNNDENILVRCPDAASLLDLISNLAAVGQKFYRYECLIVLDLQILVQIMAVVDLSPLKNQEALVVRIVDENNLKDSLRNILWQEKVFFPSVMINNSGQNRHYYDQILRPLLREFEQKLLSEIKTSKDKIASLYPPGFHKKVVKKIKNGKKLRILFCSSRYTTYTQYSIRDIAEGFRMLGHKVLIEQEKEKAGYGIRIDVALDNLCRFKPDIIFTIDHLRYEKDYIPKSIPFITWVQDLLPNIIAITPPASITEQDYIFSFSKNWAEHDLKNNIAYKNKRIHVLPVVVSSRIYKPLANTQKIYDVTSVTHLCGPESTLYPFIKDERLEGFSYSEQTVVSQLVPKLESLSLLQLRDLRSADKRKKLIQDICCEHNIAVTTKLKEITEWTRNNKESTPFRNHVLLLMKTRPVAHLLKNGIDVKAFGNNWGKYTNVRRAAMGKIKNGPELNKLFNQSRINLNTSPGTTYHMKVPEVISSKNFLLTAHIPLPHDCMPIEDFYEIDNEIVLFKDEEDLIIKVKFYLNNLEARERIASSAYKKHINKFTNKAGALTILNAIINQ